MRVTHEIKCHPKYFKRICNGSKPFEIRKNDRYYQVGDRLIINEYDPEIGYSDNIDYGNIIADITYITDFAQVNGMVVIGIKVLEINA